MIFMKFEGFIGLFSMLIFVFWAVERFLRGSELMIRLDNGNPDALTELLVKLAALIDAQYIVQVLMERPLYTRTLFVSIIWPRSESHLMHSQICG